MQSIHPVTYTEIYYTQHTLTHCIITELGNRLRGGHHRVRHYRACTRLARVVETAQVQDRVRVKIVIRDKVRVGVMFNIKCLSLEQLSQEQMYILGGSHKSLYYKLHQKY